MGKCYYYISLFCALMSLLLLFLGRDGEMLILLSAIYGSASGILEFLDKQKDTE